MVRVPGSDLSQTKTSDPADGASVDVGDEITYTLTFTNDGQAAATVDTTDDLTEVLDDATLVDGPNAGNGLTVNRTGDVLEITGTVPAGESRTVTYTVEVNAFEDQGDHVLANTLACQPGDPPTCEPETTEHPVRRAAGHQDLRRHRGHPAGRHGHLHGDRGEPRHRGLHRRRAGRGGR